VCRGQPVRSSPIMVLLNGTLPVQRKVRVARTQCVMLLKLTSLRTSLPSRKLLMEGAYG